MATCHFCGRRFANPQAVRAHLKTCPAYPRRTLAGVALRTPASGRVPKAFSPAPEFVGGELDHAGQSEAARAQERARQRTERRVEDFFRRTQEEQRARRRRALIQGVKEETVGYSALIVSTLSTGIDSVIHTALVELGRVPFFDHLSEASSILISGAGGGFDVYCGIPLYLALRRPGRSIHLANLSFASLPKGGSRTSPTLFDADADSIGSETYFPEKVLSEWFRHRGEEVTVSCFELSGVAPLRTAYETLVARHGIDAIILVDGGTDSLMTGDEAGLGTPAEDIASIAAVHALPVPRKLLACLGFGIDRYHGVSHHDVLQAVADLTRQGGYLGTFCLLPEMPEARAYVEAVEFAQERISRGSIVNASIASAIVGHFGDHHRLERTRGSTLWINPLMAQYFCFTLDKVAERIRYLSMIRQTETLFEISAIIEAFRRQIGIRRRQGIPL